MQLIHPMMPKWLQIFSCGLLFCDWFKQQQISIVLAFRLTVIKQYNHAKDRCFRLQCQSATFLGQTVYSSSPISFCFRPTGLPPPLLCLVQPISSYSGFSSYLQTRSILLFRCVINQGCFFIHVCILQSEHIQMTQKNIKNL